MKTEINLATPLPKSERSGGGLRPTVQVELIYASLRRPPVALSVRSFVTEAFGRAPEVAQIACISVMETAAEKQVALTRRAALSPSFFAGAYHGSTDRKGAIFPSRAKELARTQALCQSFEIQTKGRTVMLAEAMVALEATYYTANLVRLGREFYQRFHKAPTPEEAATIKAEARKSAEEMVRDLPEDTKVNAITLTLFKRVKDLEVAIENCYNEPGLFNSEMTTEGAVLRRRLCGFVWETQHYNGGVIPALVMDV